MATARHRCAILTAAMLIGACASTFKATHDHDPGHDFSNYQTFAWISEHPMRIGTTAVSPNPLIEPRIMSSLERALKNKGFRYTKQANAADFVLSFTVGSREEIRVDSYPTMAGPYPSRWGWGGGYYGHGTETTVRQYTKGMLAVDIFDVAKRQPVWHGVASKNINESDRENMQVTIDAAVAAIIAGFPPQ